MSVCSECLLQTCKIFKFREMAFKSNLLLRKKMSALQSKRQTTNTKNYNLPKDDALILTEPKNEDVMVDLIQSNDTEDPDNEVEYFTVILTNEDSMESDTENVELTEETSETEAIRDDEYIVAEESLDEIPKMSLKKSRSGRRTKDAANRSLTCHECGKTLSNFSSYKYHMQLHSEDTPYLCR